jgi:hypothetical protein
MYTVGDGSGAELDASVAPDTGKDAALPDSGDAGELDSQALGDAHCRSDCHIGPDGTFLDAGAGPDAGSDAPDGVPNDADTHRETDDATDGADVGLEDAPDAAAPEDSDSGPPSDIDDIAETDNGAHDADVGLEDALDAAEPEDADSGPPPYIDDLVVGVPAEWPPENTCEEWKLAFPQPPTDDPCKFFTITEAQIPDYVPTPVNCPVPPAVPGVIDAVVNRQEEWTAVVQGQGLIPNEEYVLGSYNGIFALPQGGLAAGNSYTEKDYYTYSEYLKGYKYALDIEEYSSSGALVAKHSFGTDNSADIMFTFDKGPSGDPWFAAQFAQMPSIPPEFWGVPAWYSLESDKLVPHYVSVQNPHPWVPGYIFLTVVADARIALGRPSEIALANNPCYDAILYKQLHTGEIAWVSPWGYSGPAPTAGAGGGGSTGRPW